MMDAKDVRNMYSIRVVVNKHNTARVASYLFIIYYRLVMHGNSNIKLICITLYITLYRVSQEECAKLRESVPYVKLYRYNPKHLYPKLNG